MQKRSIPHPFILVFCLALSLISTSVSAQTTTASVLFRVEIGKAVCKDGVGRASVLFISEPKEGGYFDIVGGSIKENSMTLDRRVSLQSGTYTWKGVASEGYKAMPPSIGEFTIPHCEDIPPVKSIPASLLKESLSTSTIPTQNFPGGLENKEVPNNNGTTSLVSSPDMMVSSSTDKNTIPETPDRKKMFQWIAVALGILGLFIGVFSWKENTK